MSLFNTIILRCEESFGEQRTPITPTDAATLLQAGIRLQVETSPQRIFTDAEYHDAGCEIVSQGTWRSGHGTVLGIKALPQNDEPLSQTHIYFAHAYRSQAHAASLLHRFQRGRGTLFDLEYLVDEHQRRLVSFSHFAGIAGAIASLNALLPNPYPLDQQLSLDAWQALLTHDATHLNPYRYLVTGAEGRCGGGVTALLDQLQLSYQRWTLADTQAGRSTDEMGTYDVLIHCAAALTPQPPLVTRSVLAGHHRLSLLVDITCDIGNPYNLVDLGHRITSLQEPVQVINQGDRPLRVIAIDHLPTLLARESSAWFSSQLLPLLLAKNHPAWEHSLSAFRQASLSLGSGV